MFLQLSVILWIASSTIFNVTSDAWDESYSVQNHVLSKKHTIFFCYIYSHFTEIKVNMELIIIVCTGVQVCWNETWRLSYIMSYSGKYWNVLLHSPSTILTVSSIFTPRKCCRCHQCLFIYSRKQPVEKKSMSKVAFLIKNFLKSYLSMRKNLGKTI